MRGIFRTSGAMRGICRLYCWDLIDGFLVFILGVGWLVGGMWCCGPGDQTIGEEGGRGRAEGKKSQESFVCLRRGMFADDVMFSYLGFL